MKKEAIRILKQLAGCAVVLIVAILILWCIIAGFSP